MFDFARLEPLVRQAGEVATRLFGHTRPEYKQDGTPVTEADRAAQRVLVQGLRQLEPDPHKLFVLAEEELAGDVNAGVGHAAEAELVAAVDPVDGTMVFATEIPLWAVSLGLLAGGRPLAGLILLPLLGGPAGTLYQVGPEGPATVNGAPLQVRPFSAWDELSQLAVPSAFLQEVRLVGRYRGRIRSLGSTAHHLALAAAGRVEAAVVGRTRIWDMAAGAALVERAGGVLQTTDQRPVDWLALLDGRAQREPVLAGSLAAVTELAGNIRAAGGA